METSGRAQGWWQPLGLRFQGHANGVPHADKDQAHLPDTSASGSQEPAYAKKTVTKIKLGLILRLSGQLHKPVTPSQKEPVDNAQRATLKSIVG